MKYKLPEMGFTTMITENLPVGMNIKKQCEASPMLLIMNVTKLNKKTKYIFF